MKESKFDSWEWLYYLTALREIDTQIFEHSSKQLFTVIGSVSFRVLDFSLSL